MKSEGLLPSSQGSAILKPCVTFRNELLFYGEKLLLARLTLRWKTTLVGCQRLVIKHILPISFLIFQMAFL